MSKTYNVKKIFGSALRELRESKNITQEQLAEFLDLQSYQTINRIENGKSFTTSQLFEKMCDFFNVTPAYFLSNKFNSLNKENLNYLSEIKRMLPLLPPERLKDIYNIIITLSK